MDRTTQGSERVMDLLQWPAMVVTVVAAWFVASRDRRRSKVGFWLFLVSNVLWVAWAWHAQAWALILLQFFLAATNIRGERRNSREASPA
jgi:hypothetical protein